EGTRSGTRLATHNDPIKVGEVEAGHWADQRLDRQEANSGWDRTQMLSAKGVAVALDAHTHPHVDRPVKLGCNLSEPLRALGEHLICVLRRFCHDVED